MRRKKKIDTKHLMGGFIAFIMITSVFGVLFYGFNTNREEKTSEYKGTIFTYRNNGFVMDLNGEDIFFPFFPASIEHILLDDKTKELLKQDYFIVTYDPSNGLNQEMALAQYKLFEERLKPAGKNIIRALTNSTDTNLEQFTCQDATASHPVILLQYSNETSITTENNCIIANAKSSTEVYEVSDRIAYQMLGVMK